MLRQGNHTANYRRCVKWKEAKAGTDQSLPLRSRSRPFRHGKDRPSRPRNSRALAPDGTTSSGEGVLLRLLPHYNTTTQTTSQTGHDTSN